MFVFSPSYAPARCSRPFRDYPFVARPSHSALYWHGIKPETEKKYQSLENNDTTTVQEKQSQRTRIVLPALEVDNKDTESILSVALPGVKIEDLSLETVNTSTLRLVAARGNTLQYQRTIKLNERYFDLSTMSYALGDGLLQITVPKKKILDVNVSVSLGKPEDVDEKAGRWSMDLPGVKPEDIEVHLKDTILTIKAVRKTAVKSAASIKKSLSLDYRRFELHQAKAYIEYGVLTIILPGKERKPDDEKNEATASSSENEAVLAEVEKEETKESPCEDDGVLAEVEKIEAPEMSSEDDGVLVETVEAETS